MDGKFIKRFVIPSCLIVIISTTFVYELNHLIDVLLFKKNHFFVIGILSAPENFQQRLSIRKTWLQLLPEISGSAYFIIGNQNCEVPPFDRPDPYTCLDRPFILPENVTSQTEFTTMKIQSVISKSQFPLPSYIGFGFYVRSCIIVKELGIFKDLFLVINREIQVKLVSAFDNEVLASVTFTSDMLSENISPVLTKAIKPVKLNAQYEAFIKLEIKNMENIFFPICNFATWKSEPYVINFIQLWEENGVAPLPFTENSCTFVFMSYSVVDAEYILQQTNNRSLRLKEWDRLNKNLSLNLDKENKQYNDILFVDVIDVYRNLSRKLTQFYKRIMEKEYFQYILKADDDSFVDLLRVHNHLRRVNREINFETGRTKGHNTGIVSRPRHSRLWWWSSFKEFWKVERAGKWREFQYRSVSYPTFPCGGGYVLNKGIVEYITANDHLLHHFQGEDVSMGIWLSPLPVTPYKIPKLITQNNSHYLQKKVIKKYNGNQYWSQYEMNRTDNKFASNLCEWTCSHKSNLNLPSCNKVQLNIQKMYATWKDYTSNGFL